MPEPLTMVLKRQCLAGGLVRMLYLSVSPVLLPPGLRQVRAEAAGKGHRRKDTGTVSGRIRAFWKDKAPERLLRRN